MISSLLFCNLLLRQISFRPFYHYHKIIRGKNKCKDGDDLINNLDRRIVNFAGLKGSISYFLIKDPYPPTEEEFMDDPLNWPQVRDEWLLYLKMSIRRVMMSVLLYLTGVISRWS